MHDSVRVLSASVARQPLQSNLLTLGSLSAQPTLAASRAFLGGLNPQGELDAGF
jgi:hypothetical protein